MTCNGNCNQGRLCDCVPHVEPQEADAWEPVTQGEAATLLAVTLLGVLVMVVGLCTLVGAVWRWFAA